MVGLSWMDQAYPKENEKMAEYKKLAKIMHIPIEEDPELVKERHRREMEKVLNDFGGDLG